MVTTVSVRRKVYSRRERLHKYRSRLVFLKEGFKHKPVQLVKEHFLLVIFDVGGEKGRCGHRLLLTPHPAFLLPL